MSDASEGTENISSRPGTPAPTTGDQSDPSGTGGTVPVFFLQRKDPLRAAEMHKDCRLWWFEECVVWVRLLTPRSALFARLHSRCTDDNSWIWRLEGCAAFSIVG